MVYGSALTDLSNCFDSFFLVRTGKYREGDEKRAGVMPPDEVFDSFALFIDDLLAGESRAGHMDAGIHT